MNIFYFALVWCITFSFSSTANIHFSRRASFITPCHKNQPVDVFSACILQQARNALPYFVKGIPDLGMEPIDPLTMSDLNVATGNLMIKQKNVVLKGLRNMDIRELKWDLQTNTGFLKIFGNLTLNSDYETDGQILVIPVKGTGKLTVKMDNTEITMKYKLKKVQGADGQDHLNSYDLKAKQTFGNVRFHLTSNLGVNVLTDTINQVMNENWRELMKEVGPPHTKAVTARVSSIINTLYSKVPYDELLP